MKLPIPSAVQATSVRFVQSVFKTLSAVQADKYLWYPWYLCEILKGPSRTGYIRVIRAIRVQHPFSRTG